MTTFGEAEHVQLTVRVKKSTVLALTMISLREEGMIPDIIERLVQEEATRLAIDIEKDLLGQLEAELSQSEIEQAEEDYFTEQLNKRLGFDVRDMEALMNWWKSFMEEKGNE